MCMYCYYCIPLHGSFDKFPRQVELGQPLDAHCDFVCRVLFVTGIHDARWDAIGVQCFDEMSCSASALGWDWVSSVKSEQLWAACFYSCLPLLLGVMCTGLQGSTLSSHHMTVGFGPFELEFCCCTDADRFKKLSIEPHYLYTLCCCSVAGLCSSDHCTPLHTLVFPWLYSQLTYVAQKHLIRHARTDSCSRRGGGRRGSSLPLSNLAGYTFGVNWGLWGQLTIIISQE